MTRAAIYSRISADDTDEGKGVERQEEDCRALATKLDLEVVTIYRDNDISASTLSKKIRPQYDLMLQEVRDSKIDVILAYSNSRLTRRLRELEDLIQLHEQTKVQIHTVVSGNDDLSTADGRMIARIKASVDSAEAERTGERVRRAQEQRAHEGKVKKSRYRTYGFTNDFVVVEEEAEVIRDAFRRVIAGESLQSVANRWNAIGVDLGNGAVVKFSTVNNIVKRPLYAGKMKWKGEIIGDAQVQAIIDWEVFQAAQIVLKDNSKPRGKNARRYLLGGMIHCSMCFTSISGNPGNPSATGGKRHRYQCMESTGGCGKQGIDGVKVEAMVLGVVRQLLIVRGAPNKPGQTDYSPVMNKVSEDIRAIHTARDGGDIDVQEAIALMKPLIAERKRIERLMAEQIIDKEEAGFVDWEAFIVGTLSEQKATVNHWVKDIVITPAGGKKWNPSRVTLFMRSGRELTGDYLWKQYGRIDSRLCIDGFRQDLSLRETVGNRPKKSQPIRVDGRFRGSLPADV